MKKHLSIFLYLFLLVPFPGRAERHNIINYSVAEGLSQSFTYSLQQDNFGYLWLCTYGGGVDRFDGKNFTNFSVKEGLSNNVVFKVVIGINGNLWFGTNNGICKYDYLSRKFVTYSKKEGLAHHRVWDMSRDQEGNLWLVLDTMGAARFDIKTHQFTHFVAAQLPAGKDGTSPLLNNTVAGLITNNTTAIMADKKGNVWMGTEKGLNQWNGEKFVSSMITNTLKGYSILSFMEENNGDLWVGTDKGVFLFNNKSNNVSHYTVKQGLCGNYITAIMRDRNNSIWFSSHTGVSNLKNGKFTAITTKEGLSYDKVEDIIQDREGNIWFSTQLGISQYKQDAFSYLSSRDGLKNDIVWSIWQHPDSTMWFATEKGIHRYDTRRKIFEPNTGPYRDKLVYPFYEDSRGNLWFGADKNIIKYDGNTYTNVSKQLALPPHEYYFIMQDSQGDMWFGTQRAGALKIDFKKGSVTRFNRKAGLSDNSVNDIMEDENGNIWLGTNDGLDKYNRSTSVIENISFPPGIYDHYIGVLLKGINQEIWIGTYGGGILKISSGPNPTANVEVFDSTHGLLDDEILLMIFDDNGNLWAGTNKGISVLDVGLFRDSGQKVFRGYGAADGFYGIETNQQAVCKDKQGNIWFGTIGGTIKYDLRKDKPNKVEANTHITGLKLFLEEMDWRAYSKKPLSLFGLPQDLILSYKQNHLTFQYNGISLTAPQRVRYQVKLEGFDSAWSPISDATYATYSNLSPGEYVFKVKASNNSGLWNKNPTKYSFIIKAPFWEKWWFITSMIFLTISTIFYLFKRRTRKLVEQQHILEDQIHLHTLELQEEKKKVDQINLELEERVKERTRKLALANKQLVHAQKMEAIGILAGGVAHDLNNVLAGVVSYPELLLLKIPPDSPLRRDAEIIMRSGIKAAAIVQDLLTLARRGVAVTEIVSLNQVVSEFIESPELEKILSYHIGVKIETHLDYNLKNILGSPVHLSKTLMNLVSNAAEAITDPGTVTIETCTSYISQPIKGHPHVLPGEYSVLRVTDTGSGISKEHIDKIFEPFYTKKKMGKSGTGLGMAVVWSTVKDHNGSITLDSTEGKGSTFTLYFPNTRRKKKKENPHLSIKELMGNKETILIVDDIQEQREVAALTLTRLGYSVESVNSGEKAVAYTKEKKVDLLVLDMIMEGGIDGMETYRRILERHPNQKAVIVSGFSETVAVKEAQELGAGTYIKKPFGIEQLGSAVKQTLKNS